jgi:hypothetical protein
LPAQPLKTGIEGDVNGAKDTQYQHPHGVKSRVQ